MGVSFTLRVDGGSRGNPGPSSYGVVIEDAGGTTVARLAVSLGIQTNNYAEYRGLIAALEWARDHQAAAVRVYSDSQLMVRQMQGRYAVKSANLLPLYEQARRLARGFGSFAIEHVYREQNREADQLANQAMDGAMDEAAPRTPRQDR